MFSSDYYNRIVNYFFMQPDLIGYIAATLTTVSFFPQALKNATKQRYAIDLITNVSTIYSWCDVLVHLWVMVDDGPVLLLTHVLCVDTGRSSETAKAHRG
eukprot:TRINITY_DN7199_c0_g1_i1.p2 TRINITY_DN7199_c0_g1~~TRINITY_DN7199_c0_g1_i1.p2  ORF type:complete len:100 (+),score=30.82 TRINITY_DN7199_c0_g1_i1:676-975(+)